MFFFKLLSCLNLIIPKKRKRIVLYSNLGFRDNVEALYRYLVSMNYQSEYEIVCVSNNFYGKDHQKGIKYVGLYVGVMYFLTSKYFFYCFGKYPIKPSSNQIIVNLWHGMPFKKIGNLEEKNQKKDYNYFTYLVSSSKMFYKIMKDAFNAADSQMLIAGSPRNDDLFNPIRIRNEGIQVAWMPTYRKSKLSSEGGKSIPFTFSSEDWQRLDSFLKEKDMCLFIKLHPLEKSLTSLSSLDLKNVVSIADKELQQLNISNYSFVGGMDALITDYSSVYFDYLLLNRPVAFVSNDESEFSNQRGFVFNSLELGKVKVGNRVRTIDDLEVFLNDVIKKNDSFKNQRKKLNDKVNVVKKDFSEDLLRQIGLIKNA